MSAERPFAGRTAGEVHPVFVTRMHHERHGDAFVLIAASNTDQARFLMERTIATDFPTFAGTGWTTPQHVAGLYHIGKAGVMFAAMPKQAAIVIGPGG